MATSSLSRCAPASGEPVAPHHVMVATHLPAEVTSAAEARDVVRRLLHQGDHPELVDTACLLTSELVANAVVHAHSPVELVVDLDPSRLAVEVIDESVAPPTPTRAAPLAAGGRGLAMVEALADSWGVTTMAAGKSVWFALATR